MSINTWTEDYGQDYYNGYDMTALKRDQCYVNVINEINKPLHVYSVYKECFKCKYIEDTLLNTNIVDIKFPKIYRFSTNSKFDNSNLICDIEPNFGEFGIYNLNINETTCIVEIVKRPVNIYFPILTVFLIYFVLFSLIPLFGYCYRKLNGKLTLNENNTKQRLRSLDTFRGISIVVMIFANYGCGGYAILEHAVWNGLHFADLVFPWFMWIMGVCIPISINSSLKKEINKKYVILNITRRSCILFSLGLFLGASPYLDKLRIFGVLQRFGICYFVVATLFTLLTNSFKEPETKCNLCKDILDLKFHWFFILAILAMHCSITFLLHAPGCPKGYLGPGGLHFDSNYQNCTGGAAGYIDNLILGNHIYHHLEIKTIYRSESFDPEGILGCLTSIVQVFLGVQAGKTLITYKEHLRRLTRWILWFFATGLIGGLLCKFSKEEGYIPINKNLWSISFVLVTSSLAFLLLSVCYYLIDVKKLWTGKPFIYAGMNSMIMYVGHSLVMNNFPFHWYPSSEMVLNTHFMTLIENVWATSMWILVAYYLYKIKFFFSIYNTV